MKPPSTVRDVLDNLEGLAPSSKAASWDVVGLQLGDPDAEVGSIAVAHEATGAVVSHLEEEPADLLVTYHPLLFRPVRRMVAGARPDGRAFRLIRSGIALIVAHTSFDVAPGGSADALAESLGLGGIRSFGPVWGSDAVKIVTFAPELAVDEVSAAMADAGAGVIGRYRGCSFRGAGLGAFIAPEESSPATGTAGAANLEPEVRIEMVCPAAFRDRVVAALVSAHPYEEPAFDVYERRGDAGFVGRVGELPGPEPLERVAESVFGTLGRQGRVAGDGRQRVATLAVVPGSGGDLIGEAAAAGADAIVTGDVSHHRARAAVERGIAIIDAGHAATERPGLARLYAAVSEITGNVVDLRNVDPDPWRTI